MNCFLTLKSLRLLLHGNGAPLWRTVVTLDNSTLVNVLSALVVSVSVGYVVRRVALYRFANRDDVQCSGKGYLGFLFPCLAALSFLLSPALLEHVRWLSPFLFSLVFPALSLALLVSLVGRPAGESYDGDDEAAVGKMRCLLAIRLIASGLLAAVGAWESTLGVAFALIVPVLILLCPIRQEDSVGRVLGMWFAGFAAGFAVEGFCLPACNWLSLAPAVPPIVWAPVFFFTGILPISLILRSGVRSGLAIAWGVVLAICGGWVWYGTATTQGSASETFVRRCLAELGERKLIVSDGLFDDMFRVLAPADVRVMGTRTVGDREFLIKCFSEDQALTNRALIVTHCYAFAEFPSAAREAGLILRETKPTGRKTKAAPTEAERKRLEAARKAEAEKILRPVADSLQMMEKNIADLPVEKRQVEIEKARLTLRSSWDKGVSGLRVSSMLLALDMMQGDRHALESDALTALMLDINDPSANAVLGELRLMDGRLDDAERYLKKAVKGEGAMAMCDYARLLVTRGRCDEAEAWAKKAVVKRPKDPIMREPLITALVESRQFEKAESEIRAMLDLARGDARRLAANQAFARQVGNRIDELKKSAPR